MRAMDRSRFLSQAAVLAGVLLAYCAVSFAQDTTQQYVVNNLVSNQSGVAANQDSDLVGAWGLSRSSGSPWWVSDAGTGLSTLYDGSGNKQGLVVTIPPGDPTVNPTGSPTGTIYNGSSVDFPLAAGKPALFLFSTFDGTISGWNPGVNAASAVIMVNQTGTSLFTGLAVAQMAQGPSPATYLYAADFEQGRIEVFDSNFNPVSTLGRFSDPFIPQGYAPFNIWNVGGNLYVTFAWQGSSKQFPESGAGLGYVDVFSPYGFVIQRLQHGPWLNAPWGIAVAPSDFGLYSHNILVGQFGSGEIIAFDPATGFQKGPLLNASNQPITIDGLWALSFGNDAKSGNATALYFTAAPGGANGLLGDITAIQNIQGNDR